MITLLSLTFLKEQELIGWAHSDTTGLFKSVCSVTEQVSQALLTLCTCCAADCERQTWQYIERMAEQYYPMARQRRLGALMLVSAANGSPATTFSGMQHLAGQKSLDSPTGRSSRRSQRQQTAASHWAQLRRRAWASRTHHSCKPLPLTSENRLCSVRRKTLRGHRSQSQSRLLACGSADLPISSSQESTLRGEHRMVLTNRSQT